jgi:hypothetical protein
VTGAAETQGSPPQPEPVWRLPRATIPMLGLACALTLAAGVIGLIVAINAHETATSLAPKVAGGSQTCSGGNLEACDRVCQATASRLVIETSSGVVATVFCKHSKVSARFPGSTSGPAGVVLPAGPTGTSTTGGGAGSGGGGGSGGSGGGGSPGGGGGNNGGSGSGGSGGGGSTGGQGGQGGSGGQGAVGQVGDAVGQATQGIGSAVTQLGQGTNCLLSPNAC